MTGAGAPGAAGILQCLSTAPLLHVICADANEGAYGQYLSADFIRIPAGEDPSFADVLLKIAREKKVKLILPLVTRELLPLALTRAQFEKEGIRVMVSPAASLEIANNKSRLYEFLEWRGIAVPAYRVVETVEQFRQAVQDLGFPERPVCFKPSIANGSRGFRIISDSMDELDLLFREKPGNPFISLDHATRILSGGTFPEMLVSEYLPGEEYSVDCLSDHGEPVLIVPRLRKKMINGISVEGEFVEQMEIIGYCTRIIRDLKLHGNTGIQVRADQHGAFRILEINPRVQGTISAGLGAGINLPLLAIRQELDWPLEPEMLQVKWGTRFSRYWQEVFY